jgi:thiol:disulfide interchange protein
MLFQFAPSGQMVGAIVAVAFFLVFLLAAYVAFKALKKTAKMAVRMIIVAIILVIAVAGSLSLWYFSADGTQKQKPPVQRRR